MFATVIRRSLHLSSRVLGQNDKLKGLDFKLVPINRYKEIVDHLHWTFCVDEPLSMAAGIDPNNCPDLDDYFLESLKEELSIMATDEEGKLAGVMLSGMFNKGDDKKFDEKVASIKNEGFKKIVRLLCDVNVPIDMCSKFGVDKILEARVLSVLPEYRGRRIGVELLRQTVLLAKEKGVKLIKAEATGIYSQDLNEVLGFKTIHELVYDKYLGKDGKPILKIDPPHKSVKLMYKIVE